MSANFLYVYDDGRWLILWAVQRVGGGYRPKFYVDRSCILENA